MQSSYAAAPPPEAWLTSDRAWSTYAAANPRFNKRERSLEFPAAAGLL